MSTGGPDDAALSAQLIRLRQDQERLFEQMRESEAQFKALARSVWRVQEEERRRLARELHDGLGQNLTALRHRLDALAAAVDPETPSGRTLAEARQLCDTTLADTRSLSRLLRPQILDDLGLVAALQWLCRSTGEAAGVEVELEIGAEVEPPDGDLATLLFRVAQEALTNAVKHAQAQRISVGLAQRERRLALTIVDDGRGCDAGEAMAQGSIGRSSGLAGMRERVRLFGGQFQFVSRPGIGAQVRVQVPLTPGHPHG